MQITSTTHSCVKDTGLEVGGVLDETRDGFLTSMRRGQYQQSSRWGCVKAVTGWHVERIVEQSADVLTGGFKVFWKETWLGRIGYVSKGPVLAEETPSNIRRSLRQIKEVAGRLGLRALVLQPPDESIIAVDSLIATGFLRQPLPGLICATALVDLSGGRAAIEARINRKQRQEARQASRRGLTVRFGTRADLPLFFELMVSTCQRQGVKPNPARVEVLEAVWDCFYPHARVAFARKGGIDVAGLFMIGLGDRCTFWKKGWNWNKTDPSVHVNCLLNIEAIHWAAAQGYRKVDFVGLDRSIAERLLAGRPLTPAQQRSRDVFNLRLGAQPKILPEARILVMNPVLRWLVNACSRLLWFRGWLFQTVATG